MQTKTATAIVIGLLAVGGALLWYVTRPSDAPAGTQGASSSTGGSLGSSGGYQGQSTMVTNGGSTRGTSTGQSDTETQTGGTSAADKAAALAVDLAKEYDSLFASLSAKRVLLKAVSSPGGELGSVYDLYASDVADSKKLEPNASAGYAIHAALLDLDGDKIAEALVYEDLPSFCGSGGCPVDVWQKAGTSWKRIGTGFGSGTIGLIAGESGYANLLITGQEGAVERYVWDGSAYKDFGVVATWNGKTFTPVQ